MKKIIQIYADESWYDWNHRFWTIAALSWEKEYIKELNKSVLAIVKNNNISEIKFNGIKWHSNKTKAAKESINILLDYIASKKILLTTISWDKEDERHNIPWRDDIENFKRMYYHLIKQIKLMYNFEDEIEWEFYPDEHTAVDWKKEVIFYLENTNLKKKYIKNNQQLFFNEFKNFVFPTISECKEIESCNNWIVQLADLVAGIIRMSFNDIENNTKELELFLYNKEHKKYNSLFEWETNNYELKITNNKKHKFEILYYFKSICSKYKLWLNYSKNRYFSTFNKRNNLLIWKYTVVWNYDKAPIKNKK